MLNGPSDPVVEEIGLVSEQRATTTTNGIKHNTAITNVLDSLVDEPVSGATKLRKMIFETNELIVCPGVYDGLSARTAIEVGFNAMYMVRFYHKHMSTSIHYTNLDRLVPALPLPVSASLISPLPSSTRCVKTPT